VQLRDRYEEFTSRGAQVAAVGMGTPAMAADFKREHEVPFPVLIDHTKETYRLLDFKRATLVDALKPKVLVRGAVSFLKRGQALPKQDPAQLGGAIVVDRDGHIIFIHRAKDAQDNAPVDALLEALP
jgi:peroxiredoxin